MSTSTSARTEQHCFDIQGDVTLIAQKYEILVSSLVLSTASCVFKAMFRPNFREGMDLAENRSCRVPLPDDDPDALVQFCAILHEPEKSLCQGWLVSHGETPRLLKAMATLANKYQCVGQIYTWARKGLYVMMNDDVDIDPKGCLNLLYAAYTFNVSCQFNLITEYMIYSTRNDILVSNKDGNLCWDLFEEAKELPSGLLC